jgi:hypothetical protein
VPKSFGFKAISLASSLGLAAVLVSGCNPEEPAKTTTPPPTTPGAKAPMKAGDTKGGAPAPVTPAPKEGGEKPKAG